MQLYNSNLAWIYSWFLVNYITSWIPLRAHSLAIEYPMTYLALSNILGVSVVSYMAKISIA